MFNELSTWLDGTLSQDIPDGAAAFCFNLYDDGDDNWSLELVATERFDPADADWPCEELDDFGTRDEPFAWNEAAEPNAIYEEINDLLARYLEEGSKADVLTSLSGVGLGFVDGDLGIIYISK